MNCLSASPTIEGEKRGGFALSKTRGFWVDGRMQIPLPCDFHSHDEFLAHFGTLLELIEGYPKFKVGLPLGSKIDWASHNKLRLPVLRRPDFQSTWGLFGWSFNYRVSLGGFPDLFTHSASTPAVISTSFAWNWAGYG